MRDDVISMLLDAFCDRYASIFRDFPNTRYSMSGEAESIVISLYCGDFRCDRMYSAALIESYQGDFLNAILDMYIAEFFENLIHHKIKESNK